MMTTNKTKASAKYPGWSFEHSIEFGRESWFMINTAFPRYGVDIVKQKDGRLSAEILTRSFDKLTGRSGWDPARKGFNGTPAACMAEVIRRGNYHRAQRLAAAQPYEGEIEQADFEHTLEAAENR